MTKGSEHRAPLTLPLGEIARSVGGEVVGEETLPIKGVGSLEAAGPGDISFFADSRYREAFHNTRASAVIVTRENPESPCSQVVVANPALAYARVAGLFAPPVPRFPGVSSRAWIHRRAALGRDVSIYPWVYVGDGAEIGDEVALFPGVFVGERVRIGARSVIYPNVTILADCVLGTDVIVHPGTVIGSDGFGYVREGPRSVKIPQIGNVQIDDHVEIGANNCIDRAALGRTWIQRGVKTDNLVQIAHNVIIGEDTIVVAQAGISGSVRVGRGVIIGGQAGIADHLEIGEGAMVGSQAGVAKAVPPGQRVSGCPAVPHRIWLRNAGLSARLPELQGRLKRLEKRLAELEKALDRPEDG